MKIVCKHCGKTRSEHCEFEALMPEGCECDPGTWDADGDGGNIGPVCESFVGDNTDRHCSRCEHDFACHKK